MDWTKAKTILIVALLFTNLVLIAFYFSQNNNFESDAREMQEVTVKLLESKNIYLKTDIPDEHPRMPKLTVQFDTMDENLIQEQIDRQKVLSDKEQADNDKIKEITTKFIENCGMMSENVKLGKIERTNSGIKVTYKNYMNGVTIEDSYIIFTIVDGKITDFQRYWLDPLEVSEIKKEVIPAVAALIQFMSDNKAEEKIYVQDISLVYWLDSSSFDAESPVTDTAFPAWKITYNRGKIQYVPAWEQ